MDIENKNTWGNPKWLIKIAMIEYCITIILETIGGPIFGERTLAFDMMHITLLSIPICIGYYSFWKTQNIDDIYGIRKEILYQVIAELIANVFTTIMFLVVRLVPSVRDYTNIVRFEWLIYVLILPPLFITIINIQYRISYIFAQKIIKIWR